MNRSISVIGLGYVGLPLAILADQKNYHVIGIDTDPKKIALLNKKLSPFHDKKISKDLKTSGIIASQDYNNIQKSSIIIICVPTYRS